MFLKTFVIISALSCISSQQMTCTYNINSSKKYQCNLSINNPTGLDNAIAIGGNHLGTYIDPFGNLLSSYNDSSVTSILMTGITKNIPSAICKQFPNAELLYFDDASIEIISGKCSKATELHLTDNLITEVLIDICQYQPSLTKIYLQYNKIKVISNTALKSCKNLKYFYIQYNQISAIGSTFFANNPVIGTINIGGNPITVIPAGLFDGLGELTQIDMYALLVTDLPLNIFPATNKIYSLSISSNKFTKYRPEWFQNLKQVSQLWLNYNQAPITANLIKPMTSLAYFFMINCNISVIDTQWFSALPQLYSLSLDRNNIIEIPDGTFAANNALRFLDIGNNKLKTIRSKWFSNTTLQSVADFNLDNNEVNAIDPLFFEIAKNLNAFSLINNKCYTGPKITDFRDNRSSYMSGFKTCIDNFA